MDLDDNATAWFERIEVDSVLAGELAADNAWVLGAVGVEERVPQGAEPAEPLVVLAAFPGEDAARLAASQLEGRWPGAEAVGLVDGGWNEAWRAHAQPIAVGERIIVCPLWLDPDSAATDLAAVGVPRDLVLRVDPGPTFGSGSHASTQLALAALERVVRPGDSVLDVGCGSGILSVGAALLGAASVTATDIDPAAPAVVTSMAEANEVGDVIHVSTDPLAALPGRHDVVVANILAPVLEELAQELVRHLAPGGHLVLSGMLDARVTSLLQSFPSLTVASSASQDGWAQLTLGQTAA